MESWLCDQQDENHDVDDDDHVNDDDDAEMMTNIGLLPFLSLLSFSTKGPVLQ